MEYEINLENLIHMKRVFEVRWRARGMPDRLDCELPITRAVSRRRRPSALAMLHAPRPVRSPSLCPLLPQEADEDGSGELDPDEFYEKLGPYLGQSLSQAEVGAAAGAGGRASHAPPRRGLMHSAHLVSADNAVCKQKSLSQPLVAAVQQSLPGCRPTPAPAPQVAQLFMCIDADCGGTIDWDEFVNYFFLQVGGLPLVSAGLWAAVWLIVLMA